MCDNNIQEFEIGQKVLIVGAGYVQDDFEHEIYFVRPEMDDLVGKVATISSKRKHCIFNERFAYHLEEFGYVWADKWLAPIYNTNDFIYA